LLEIFIVHLYQVNWPHVFSSFFSLVRFASAQLTSSPPFSLPRCYLSSDRCHHSAAPCHTSFLLSKTSSLPPLHLMTTLHPIASPLELKLKHWIRNTAVGYLLGPPDFHPPLLYKYHLNLGHSPHHSTASLFYLLPRQSTTPSYLHQPSSFSFIVVSRPSSLCTIAPTVMKPSFTFQTACRHANSHKKIFWNTVASCGVINY
jgi:hypothetical protein